MASATEDTLNLTAESEAPRAGSRFMRPVEAMAALLLVVVVSLLLMGALSRYFLSLPIIWGDEVRPSASSGWPCWAR